MPLKVPKKVAEGGYGCVFRPALKCDSATYVDIPATGYVSKAMSHKHALSELSEYKRIDKADPTNKYHLESPTKCNMEHSDVNLKLIKKCKVLDELTYLDIALLQLKDGGVSLKEFAKSNPSESDMEKFLVDFYNIILALCLLEQQGLHHIDLKPHNIVYNKVKRIMVMIDFGLMVSKSQIDNFYNSRPVSHFNYPPELFFIRHSNLKPGVKLDEPYLFKYQKDNGTNSALEYVEFTPEEKAIFIHDYESDISNLDINDIMKYSRMTHDVYGAGFAFLYVLNKNKTKLHPSVFDKFYSFGKEMMHGSAARRLSPETAKQEYELLLEISGLLPKQNKKIINGSIVSRTGGVKSNSQRLTIRVKRMPTLSAAKLEKITTAPPPPPITADCPDGKERVGKRCLKKCADGKVRNPATARCVKSKIMHAKPDCPEGKEHNPATARCVKSKIMHAKPDCPEGKERNVQTGRCINKCGPGQVRNEKTRRCIKAR